MLARLKHILKKWLCVVLIASQMVSLFPIQLWANPQGGVVGSGSATFDENGKVLNVNQSSGKVVIDWRGFDIALDEITNFNQPNSSSIALNRVGGNNASQIMGQLNANGKIVIVNPNGVLFGAGSKVDVNGLVVSTADTTNENFMNSDKLKFDKAGNPDATITNNGTITAKDAGLVGVVAPNVINNGTITANLGRVQLSSGDTATVDFYGDELMSVAVSSDVKSQL